MRSRNLLLVLGLCLALGGWALLHACSNGGSSKVLPVNSKGEATVTVQNYDALLVGLEGGEVQSHYDFLVIPVDDPASILGQARLFSDSQGDIAPALMLIDVDPAQVPEGTYEVAVNGPGVTEVVIIDVEFPSEPYLYTCDPAGAVKNSYLVGEPIYVRGGNFLPNMEVHLAGIADRSLYSDGDILDPPFGTDPNGGSRTGGVVVANTDANGDLLVTQIPAFLWFDTEGTGFDVIADFEPYGEFNADRDAADGHAVVGATYQIDNVGTDVDAELACDQNGVYRETFGVNDDIYIWINPPLQYVTPQKWVDKYIVNHQDEWVNGDLLQDVSGGSEMDGVQAGCTNEYIVMVTGPMAPGDYDAIIDVDQDGKYTQGLDIVDGGSAESFGKVGFKVE